MSAPEKIWLEFDNYGCLLSGSETWAEAGAVEFVRADTVEAQIKQYRKALTKIASIDPAMFEKGNGAPPIMIMAALKDCKRWAREAVQKTPQSKI